VTKAHPDKDGCILKAQPVSRKQDNEVGTKISHFSLPGLLPPGLTLALNLETRTLALLTEGPLIMREQRLSVNEMYLFMPILEALNLETRPLSLLTKGPLIMREQRLSVNEMCVIMPILEAFPHYCPYEELLAHISTNMVTPASIARCRQRLQEAQSHGTWQQELRPIRRALSSLRNKLHSFQLEISNVRERGCSLTSLTSLTERLLVRPDD